MNRYTLVVLSIFVVAATTAPAWAAETPETDQDSMVWGVGARVGGYGFRQVNEEGSLNWEDCRMNGTGLFGTLDFTRHFFAELSADLYHATGDTVVEGMDRMAFHGLASAGARLLPGALITPYIQAGGGPEWTSIDIAGASKNYLLAAGFMGIGGELNLGDFHFGSNLRVFAMGHPEHDHTTHHQALGPDSTEVRPDDFEVQYEIAGQLQFLARYTF